MNFLDVKTDYAFKKVFGSESSTDILISFLNALIEFDEAHQIEQLSIVNPYQIPILKGMKDTYVDVKAHLADGRTVIIEMQVLNVEGFEKRILYNAAKSYSSQLSKGEQYTLLNPVIGLTLTDFEMFEGTEATSRFKLLEKERMIEYSDDIELIFIELPKFNKDETELKSIHDKWIYFVKNAGDLKAIPEVLKREHVMMHAFEIANTADMTEDELEQQERRFDFIRLQKGAWSLAEKRGMEQGVKQGMEQGVKQGMEQGVKQGVKQGMEKGVLIGKIHMLQNFSGHPLTPASELVELSVQALTTIFDDLETQLKLLSNKLENC